MERVGQRCGRAGGEGDRGGLSDQLADRVLDLNTAEQLCSEPSPLEQVRRALAAMAPGQRLEVRSRIADHAFSVRAWSRKQGVVLLRDDLESGEHVLLLVAG